MKSRSTSPSAPSDAADPPNRNTAMAIPQANRSGVDGAVELEQMKPSEEEMKLPLHEDIMQLAMLGEIGPIQTLIDEGKYSANSKDKEGITPLHVSCLFPLRCLANAGVFSVGSHK